MHKALLVPLVFVALTATGVADELEWIRVSTEGRRFVRLESNETFRPWGLNYDHEGDGQLLED